MYLPSSDNVYVVDLDTNTLRLPVLPNAGSRSPQQQHIGLPDKERAKLFEQLAEVGASQLLRVNTPEVGIGDV